METPHTGSDEPNWHSDDFDILSLPAHVHEPTPFSRSIPSDELMDLLWRGEHPAIAGFSADEVSIELNRAGQLKSSDLIGITEESGEEFRTTLHVSLPGLLGRFIRKLRSQESHLTIQGEKAVIPLSILKQ